MKINTTKQFNSREELDKFIQNTYGDDSNANKSIAIEATDEECKTLFLSEKVNVFGVKIKKQNAKV